MNLNSDQFDLNTKQNASEEGAKATCAKSVQWADWEMKDVTNFVESTEICIDDRDELIEDDTQEQNQNSFPVNALPLIQNLIETTQEMSSLVSESPPPSITAHVEDDERQAALSDLITHLEDTAALLREYLMPPKPDIVDSLASSEQTSFILRYQVVLVLFTQLVNILLLSLFDHLTKGKHETGYEVLTRSCGTVLQILNMAMVLFATVVLSRQMLKYKVEGSFLAQTYIATVITFAGLYFIIYRFEPDSWEFASTDKMEENVAISQYIKMLYLSVSAATLCGAANIQPRYWYVTLLLCFQSLVNFVYFASILAQTIGNYHSYTVQVRRSSSMSRHNLNKTS